MNDKKLKLAFHSLMIDKNVGGNRSLFVEGFENVEVTLVEVGRRLQLGHSYCAQLTGRRCAANFLACDAISVDIDEGISVEEARRHPFIQNCGSLLYTTVSHTPECPRLRIIFVTPRTITEAQEMRVAARALAHLLGGDPAATDPARLFYGNRQAEIILIGNALTPEILDDLLHSGSVGASNSSELEKGLIGSRRRYELTLPPDQVLRAERGDSIRLANAEQKTRVHCPVHDDRSPSAFVVENRRGVKGVFCSACRTTFWPNRGDADDNALEDFEAVVRAADTPTGYQPRGPIGRFANEWLAKEKLSGRHIHIVQGHPTPPVLLSGITFVKSPKGSGKTEGVKHLLAGRRSVLMISHRRSLVSNASRRIGLTSYLDAGLGGREPDELDWDDSALSHDRHPVFGHLLSEGELVDREQRLKRHFVDKRRYAVCLDSLTQINPKKPFDVILLDEVQQLLAHFLSETIERRRGGNRDRIFTLLRHLIREAKYVIALDADLGWASFVTLMRMISGVYQGRHYLTKKVHVWINEAEPTQKKPVQVFASQDHLIADLRQAVSQGKRCFVTANSRRLVGTIAAGLKAEFGETRRVLLITSKTASREEVLKFLADPIRGMEQHDVVLASPSIGTGVDITFAGGVEKVDAVYGFLLPNMISHLDFDQQLARVRHPSAVKVWIDPRTYSLETHLDVVQSSILRESLYKNLLLDYDPDGTPRYIEDDPFIEMAALITTEKQLSLNHLRGNFIRYKRQQGVPVEVIGHDAASSKIGRDLQKVGKARQTEELVRQLTAARPLSRLAYERINAALKAGRVVPDVELWSYERTIFEMFYREKVTESLVERDDHGRYRVCVSLFEGVAQMPAEKVWRGDPQASLRQDLRFIAGHDEKVAVLRRLLRLTPFWQEVRFGAGSTAPDAGSDMPHVETTGCLDPEVVFGQGDLRPLIDFLLANKGQVETALGLEVRRDIRSKAVRQLNDVLRLIGLKAINVGSKKAAGEKIYRYQLDGDQLKVMLAIVRRRARRGAWSSLTAIHGLSVLQDWDDDLDQEA